MLKKINDILSGIAATLIGGAFLICSFILNKLGISLAIDPAWVTVIISGIPLLYLAVWRTVHNKGVSKISSAHLICVAMFAAILIGDLFAAGEVAFIMAIGAILEDMTTNRAKKGLKKLISLAPDMGRRIIDGREEMIPTEKISKDDTLRILPGESVPVDGVIISGETSIDQSIITGESLPIDKAEGDEVYCGTINRFGAVDIRATNVGQDSSLQKLIRMVQEAENKKAPMARIADVAASWLVPLALLIAIVAGIATGELVRAVTVLVVFCPCALVLATPTAIMAAIGQATKHGVIIKSGEALEKMGKADTVAFDKTGTLTFGKLDVCNIVSFDRGLSEADVLSITASAEAKSEHPLGRAIVEHARQGGIALSDTESFEMSAGRGVLAKIRGKEVLCGNERYLTEHGVYIGEHVRDTLEAFRKEGMASVLTAQCGKCIGMLALSDVLRDEAGEMVSRLSKMNTESVLLTGDNRMAAEHFAKRVGIKRIFAELLPGQKAESIAALQQSGKVVCMIGDGVNDAPALKTADVGVAMGGMGSDIAIEAADIALVGDDLSKVPYLKRLSIATVRTIKASITLSMIINFVAVFLSVKGVLNPTTGALVHNAGSCFVVLIAALLYDRNFK